MRTNTTHDKTTGEALRAGAAFVVYVRTLQFFGQRFRGETEARKPVHIPQKDIESTFFKWPQFDRKTEISKLIAAGEILVHEEVTEGGRKIHKFEALKPGKISFEFIKPKGRGLDETTQRMLSHLKEVSLPPGAPSTPYFDVFLIAKEHYCRLFFTVDSFAGRVHTPVTNFHRTHRPNLLLRGEKMASLDVATMQPLLLGKILLDKIGPNDFSKWINEGRDIYSYLQQLANLPDRKSGKKRFFEILFSKPSENLIKLFGASDWITWINDFKRQKIDLNPTTEENRHNNVAWLLQSTEVKVMRQVWQELNRVNIPFLSVHDEILIRNKDKAEAEGIFSAILKREFDFFKLNSKGSNPLPVNNPPTEQERPYRFYFDDDQRPGENALKMKQEANELEKHFQSVTIPQGPVKINLCTTIINPALFLSSHLTTIKRGGPPRIIEPYIQRLRELKTVIKQA